MPRLEQEELDFPVVFQSFPREKDRMLISLSSLPPCNTPPGIQLWFPVKLLAAASVQTKQTVISHVQKSSTSCINFYGNCSCCPMKSNSMFPLLSQLCQSPWTPYSSLIWTAHMKSAEVERFSCQRIPLSKMDEEMQLTNLGVQTSQLNL